MKQALVIEDVFETSQWLEAVLLSAFPSIQVAVCRNLRDAQFFLNTNKPDLSLVDISLPDGSGVSLIPRLLKTSPQAYVVITSILDDQDHVLAALQAGAQGYLLKDLPQAVFIQKLQGILQGEPPLSPKIARKILHYFSHPPVIAGVGVMPVSTGLSSDCQLSDREKEVLTLLGKGLSRREVGRLLELSDSTIATHIRNVYRKLNISSRAEAALEACRLGLIRQDI